MGALAAWPRSSTSRAQKATPQQADSQDMGDEDATAALGSPPLFGLRIIFASVRLHPGDLDICGINVESPFEA